jgi:hypothetical protein
VAAAERRGIRSARAASLSTLLGLILVAVAPIVLFVVDGLAVARVYGRHGAKSVTVTLFEQFVEVIAVGVALLIIAGILYTLCFASFRRVYPGFSGPTGLGIVGLIGCLLILLGLASYLVQSFSASACSVSTLADCAGLSAFYLDLSVVVGGLLLAFIGWIGLIIGIFRIGKRYGSTITKVGAILYIVPVLNVVAPILIYVGVAGIRPQVPAPPPPSGWPRA